MMDCKELWRRRFESERTNRENIVIPKWALILCQNDLHTALFLKQCVYWCLEAKSPLGFYHSFTQWKETTYLTRQKVETALKTVNKLAGMEVVTTSFAFVNGANRTHYRVDWEALEKWSCEYLHDSSEVVREFTRPNEPSCEYLHDQSCENSHDINSKSITVKSSPDETVNSFSSTVPSASESVQPAEKEKVETNISNLRDEKLLLKFAQIVGKNSQVSSTRKALINALDTMCNDGQTVELSDFDTYLEFYRSEKRTSFLPSIGFVVTGWPGYKTWLRNYLDQTRGDYLPGIDDYLVFTRADWQWIESLQPGEDLSFTDQRGIERHYIKQPDGTFALTEIQQAS